MLQLIFLRRKGKPVARVTFIICKTLPGKCGQLFLPTLISGDEQQAVPAGNLLKKESFGSPDKKTKSPITTAALRGLQLSSMNSRAGQRCGGSGLAKQQERMSHPSCCFGKKCFRYCV